MRKGSCQVLGYVHRMTHILFKTSVCLDTQQYDFICGGRRTSRVQNKLLTAGNGIEAG